MAYDGGVFSHIGSIHWKSIGNRHTKVVGAGLGEIPSSCSCSFPCIPSSRQETSDTDSLSFALPSFFDFSRLLPLLSPLSREGRKQKSPCRHSSPALSPRLFSSSLSFSPIRYSQTVLSLEELGELVLLPSLSDGESFSFFFLERRSNSPTLIPVPFSADNPRYLHCGPKCLPRHFARGHASPFIDSPELAPSPDLPITFCGVLL